MIKIHLEYHKLYRIHIYRLKISVLSDATYLRFILLVFFQILSRRRVFIK